jgi:uncharacterized protein YodC (DUF2158 family)
MANPSVLEVGNLVVLKSGGPSMTIKNSEVEGEVSCQWFVGGKLSAASFPRESLRPADEPPAATISLEALTKLQELQRRRNLESQENS